MFSIFSAFTGKTLRHVTKQQRPLRLEALEDRKLLSASSLVLYNAATITSYANVGFVSNPVASLDAYVNGIQDRNASHFHAVIDWGDSTGWQPGQIALSNTPGSRIPFIVKGSHAYNNANIYSIKVLVTGDGMTLDYPECAASVHNLPAPASLPGTKPDNLGGPKALGNTSLVTYSSSQLTAIQGKAVQGTVALGDGYYDGPQDPVASDYKVQINWGDSPNWELGQVVSQLAPGERIPFKLQGTHVYANTGLYQVVVVFTGPDGQTTSQQTTTVNVKPDPTMPAPLLLKGSVAVTDAQIQAMNLAQKMDIWATKVENAVTDAVKSFATGLATDVPPPQISLFDPTNNPFSRSFFDAGRMLRGIGIGTWNLPGDLMQMAKNIVAHPETLSPAYPVFLAGGVVYNAVTDPDGTAFALGRGFEAFRNIDPAKVGGQSIPGAVLMQVLGPTSPLAGKVADANAKFALTVGAKPDPNFTGMSPALLPPSEVVPATGTPLSATINKLRWANLLSKSNPGYGTAVGRTENCAYGAVVQDQILRGYSLEQIEQGLMLKTAPPGGPQSLNWIQQFYPGKSFSDEMSAQTLVGQMLHSNDGARGIVAGIRYNVVNGVKTPDVGHAFNVVNNHGVITFYDMNGQLASLGDFEGFSLLRTN